MVPIGVYDTVLAREAPPGQLTLKCRWGTVAPRELLGDLPAVEDNLALRAAQQLRERSGCERGLALELIKRIPSAAGLGGGSADAAAALVAANEVWQLGWSRAALADVAAELGSDISFFLFGGAAICRGRGEQIEPLSGTLPLHFVIARPPAGLSTAQVYARCEVPERPRQVQPLVTALRGGTMRNLKNLVYNRLQPAAETLSPWVRRLQGDMSRQDLLADQMSGSGTSYFGICRHARHARRVAGRLRAQGVGWVCATSARN